MVSYLTAGPVLRVGRGAQAAPRVGVTVALLCVAFFLLPQPKPRYKPGEEPDAEAVTDE